MGLPTLTEAFLTDLDVFRQATTNVVPAYVYKGVVRRVVDGDTVDVLLRYDVGFDRDVEWTQRLRLARIDAPEQRRPTLTEGRAATAWLKNRLPVGAVVWVHSHKDDSFGRYIADIHTDDTTQPSDGFISDQLVTAGHAIYRDY